MVKQVDVAKARARVLVRATEGAAILGVSLRSFHNIRAKLPEAARVQLGPKLVMYRVAELEAWAASLPAQRDALPEPAHLSEGRARRRASAGSPGGVVVGCDHSITQSEDQRGEGQTRDPSNSSSEAS